MIDINGTFTYEYVKDCIEKDGSCKLISKEYIRCRDKLELQCECKENFWISFDSFQRTKKRVCNTCSKKIMA